MFGFSFFDYSLNCLDFIVKTKTVAVQLQRETFSGRWYPMQECISYLCPLGRILYFILLQSSCLLYSCYQGYCGGLLAQQGALTVAPPVMDSSYVSSG